MKTPKTFLFWKKNISFRNITLLQSNCYLVPNMCMNIKYKIVLFKKCQIKSFVPFSLLSIPNLAKGFYQIVILKKSGAIDEVKIVFSNNSLQINLRAIYQISELFTADFVLFFCAILKFFILQRRLGTRLYLCPILRFSWNFLIS